MALRADDFRRLRVEAVALVEETVGLGIERAGRQRNIPAAKIGGLAGQKRQLEALGEPSGEADMIGMEMRDDQPRQRPAAEARDEALPSGARGLVIDAGVEHGPALAILDEKNVHVIEPERQRDAGPER